MRRIGYSCVELATGNEIVNSFILPLNVPNPGSSFGKFVSFDQVGQEAPSDSPIYKLVERWEIEPFTKYHTRGPTPIIMFDGIKIVIDPSWVLENMSDIVTNMKTRIKSKASNLILASMPEWKQRNIISEGIDLLETRVLAGSWTAGEQTRVDELNVVWDKVKAMRAHSDTLEAEIDVLVAAPGTDDDRALTIQNWTPHDWPSM